jgi:hypothetical protein
MKNYLKNSIVFDVLLSIYIWNKTKKDILIVFMAYEGHNPALYTPPIW